MQFRPIFAEEPFTLTQSYIERSMKNMEEVDLDKGTHNSFALLPHTQPFILTEGVKASPHQGSAEHKPMTLTIQAYMPGSGGTPLPFQQSGGRGRQNSEFEANPV